MFNKKGRKPITGHRGYTPLFTRSTVGFSMTTESQDLGLTSVLVDSMVSPSLYRGVRTHTDHRVSPPRWSHLHLFQQHLVSQESPIQILTSSTLLSSSGNRSWAAGCLWNTASAACHWSVSVYLGNVHELGVQLCHGSLHRGMLGILSAERLLDLHLYPHHLTEQRRLMQGCHFIQLIHALIRSVFI